MCHAVAAAAPAVHCNGIQPYKGAAWEEGRLLLLSSGGVINYLALWIDHFHTEGGATLSQGAKTRRHVLCFGAM